MAGTHDIRRQRRSRRPPTEGPSATGLVRAHRISKGCLARVAPDSPGSNANLLRDSSETRQTTRLARNRRSLRGQSDSSARSVSPSGGRERWIGRFLWRTGMEAPPTGGRGHEIKNAPDGRRVYKWHCRNEPGYVTGYFAGGVPLPAYSMDRLRYSPGSRRVPGGTFTRIGRPTSTRLVSASSKAGLMGSNCAPTRRI